MSIVDHIIEHSKLGVDKFLVRYRAYATLQSAAQSIPNSAGASTHTTVILNTTAPDADPSTDDPLGVINTSNGRFTVPAGYNYARLTGGISWAANATGRRQMGIRKNGVALTGSPQTITPVNSATEITVQSGTSTIVPVVAGDYFTLAASQNSGGSLNVSIGIGTWLAIELM